MLKQIPRLFVRCLISLLASVSFGQSLHAASVSASTAMVAVRASARRIVDSGMGADGSICAWRNSSRALSPTCAIG